MIKKPFAFLIVLISFGAFSKEATDNCKFFGQYAEIFYLEKNNQKSTLQDSLDSLLFAIHASEDYQSLDIYEKKAFNLVIKDLANQIYFDDSKSVSESKSKAIAYCKHNKDEIERTQSQRIVYCQNKGSISEMVFDLARAGISENEVLSNIGRLNENEITIEYKNTVTGIEDIFKLHKSNPNIESEKVGEIIYKECLINRG